MQLQQGLASCGLLDSVRENPKLWKAVFTDVPQASATIEEYLENLVASFSDSQLLKNKEIDVYKLLTDFIESLTEEGMWLLGAVSQYNTIQFYFCNPSIFYITRMYVWENSNELQELHAHKSYKG